MFSANNVWNKAKNHIRKTNTIFQKIVFVEISCLRNLRILHFVQTSIGFL